MTFPFKKNSLSTYHVQDIVINNMCAKINKMCFSWPHVQMRAYLLIV